MHPTKDNHTHTLPGTSLDIPILSKSYDLYKLFNQYLVLFPKTKRYSLGQKIDQLLLVIIELIVTAGYMPREQKIPILEKVSIKLDLLKLLLRLSSDTKCLENNKYQQLAAITVEIGRMLGGWIKTSKQPLSNNLE